MGRHRALPAGAPSPWEELARMEQQMDAMQRAMDSSFGSSFGNIDRFERQMDEEMRAMDQHVRRAGIRQTGGRCLLGEGGPKGHEEGV